jgi:hypothetical protein
MESDSKNDIIFYVETRHEVRNLLGNSGSQD